MTACGKRFLKRTFPNLLVDEMKSVDDLRICVIVSVINNVYINQII